MRWEALFADLEGQLAGAAQSTLDSEVSELVRLDQSALRMVSRLRGQLGATVRARVSSGQDFEGELVSVGSEWLVLTSGERSTLVPFSAVVHLQGLGRASALDTSISGRKLGLASALRALSRDRARVSLYLRDPARQSGLDGIIDRVGRDFLDLAVVPDHEFRRSRSVSEVFTVPLHALAAVVSI